MPNAPSDVDSAPDSIAKPVSGLPLQPAARPAGVVELGGPPGPEPTRFGDWEKNGRCVDF